MWKKVDKKHILILSALLSLMAFWAVFASYKKANAAITSTGLTEDDFVYLAETAMVKDDYDVAEDYLMRMYSTVGESAKGTLSYARLSVLKDDFTGAAILYGKLETTGETGVMADIDRSIYERIKSGQLTDFYTASAVMAQIKQLESTGADITEYGYTAEQRTSMEQIANGTVDVHAELVAFLQNDIAGLEAISQRVGLLNGALAVVDGVDEQYKSYLEYNSFDKGSVENYATSLDTMYKSYPDLFSIPEIDEAYIRVLIMLGRYSELAQYADNTGSQLALCSVGQLLADGDMSDTNLPAGFSSINSREINEVSAQCNETLQYIKEKKKKQGAELRELENNVEYISRIKDNASLVDVENRIKPEQSPLKDQSPLYIGKSAICYDLGNTEMGDAYFEKALETGPYSGNPEFTDAIKNVNSSVYETGEDNDVKGVGEYVGDAYDYGVPHSNGYGNNEFGDKSFDNSTFNPDDDVFGTENNNNPDNSNHNNGFNIDDFTTEDDSNLNEMSYSQEAMSTIDQLSAMGTTYVAKENAAINIGQIDISEFPKVKFNLSTSEPLDLKNKDLMIDDCNIIITDYEIEEVVYDTMIIYAVCDKSGSMEGSTGRLQSAVSSLAGSISDKERIGIIGFSDGVEFDSGIVSDPSELNDYISMLEAGGGTNIASGTFQALSNLSGHEDSINVVIVMTDGEDDTFGEDNLQRLRDYTSDGHTVVYTIGMGSSVNSSYLRKIADAGNGKFVYSFSASELKAIYEFIHSQMEHNYVVTFTAKNTKKNERVLTVGNLAEGCNTSKNYTLGIEEEGVSVVVEEDEDQPFACTGFSTKKIYRTTGDVDGFIRGKGFSSSMKCFVTLTGTEYVGTLGGTFVDSEMFKVVIPSKVPPGKYKAVITIDTGTFTDEIEILNDDEKYLRYGAYVFQAKRIDRDEEHQMVTISGDVLMNGYLHFKGDVLLEGDLKDQEIKMSSVNGSFIDLKKAGVGIAFWVNTLELGNWRNYTLHNDEKHMKDLDNYEVDTISWDLPEPMKMFCMLVVGPSMQLYPHKVAYKAGEINFNFPAISQLYKDATGKDIPFKFEASMEGFADGTGNYTKGAIDVEDLVFKAKFMGVSVGLKKFEYKWDTFKKDMDLTIIVNGDLIPKLGETEDDDNYGVIFGIKNGWFNTFKIVVDIPVILSAPPSVPLSINNVTIGITDVPPPGEQSGVVARILHSTFEGSLDISVGKFKDFCKSAGAVFGDMSIITFADTTASLNFSKDEYKFETTAKLLGEFECGKAEMALDHFEYSSFVLGKRTTGLELQGFRTKISVGPKIDLPRFKLSGQYGGEFVVYPDAFRCTYTGDVEAEFDFFGGFKNKFNGAAEYGSYNWGKDQDTFYVGFRGVDGNNNKVAMRIGFSGWKPYIKFD
ncbi:MAG: VWA domain-containing protein [Lachnospiraceae bacterium]|nr:VWA domain-containing protein [Lachnospiraceae bacterium]